MKKTIIAWGLSVLVLSTAASPYVDTVSFAEESVEMVENGFHYISLDGPTGKTACIHYYNGPEQKLFVPETLGGMPVTEIQFTGAQNPDKITEISLPKSIVAKGITAKDGLYASLSYLKNLSSITVSDENPELAAKDGVLFTKDFGVLLAYPKAKTDTCYKEPDTVKISYGYSNSRFLKEITFSSNKIYTAPGKCKDSSIEKAVFPPNITEIGKYTFWNCASLKEIQWGGNEKRIGQQAFAYCTALTDVTLPKSMTKLGEYAFASCKKLKKIKLPFGLMSIGTYAFDSTISLKNITIPDSVLEIGYLAFGYYSHVKIKKAPYLKKVAYEDTYSAQAKVAKKGNVKNYAAGNITGIKADKQTVSIKKGKRTVLKTVVYIRQKKKGTLDSSMLSYCSGNKAVARVTKKGVVKGLKKGTAKVWVKLRTTGENYEVKIRVK